MMDGRRNSVRSAVSIALISGVVGCLIAFSSSPYAPAHWPTALSAVLLSGLAIGGYYFWVRTSGVSKGERLLVVMAASMKTLFVAGRYWLVAGSFGQDSQAYGADLSRYLIEGLVWSRIPISESLFVWPLADPTILFEQLAGAYYRTLGPSTVGLFLTGSVLGFLGGFLIWRGACVAFPNHKRLWSGAIILLSPSALFWPTGYSKESWTLLCVGVAFYSLTRFFRQGHTSWVGLHILGVAGAGIVRPQMVPILGAATVASVVTSAKARGLPTSQRYTAYVVGVLGAMLIASNVGALLEVEATGVEAISENLTERIERTRIGDSAFRGASAPLSPVVLLSLFRPFPWETTGIPQLIASLEGMVVLALLANRRWWSSWAQRLTTDPLCAWVTVVAIVFTIGMGGLANFGILARIRVHVLPFVAIATSVRGSSVGSRA